MASTQTRNVARIEPGIWPPVALSTRGWVTGADRRTATKFVGTNAPATAAKTAAARAGRSGASIAHRRGWEHAQSRNTTRKETSIGSLQPHQCPHDARAQIEPVNSTPTARISERGMAT